jgi:hypothetical protein
MEMEFYGNHLKLENNEIYCYKKNKRGYYWWKKTFTLNTTGYLNCSLTNNKIRRTFYLHRLMYLFYNPDFDIYNSKLQIDHIDINPLNNNIENLRVVTHQENQFNKNFKGCYFHKKNKKWVAQITINSKLKNLGSYDTEEEAHNAYLQAKKEYHFIPKK